MTTPAPRPFQRLLLTGAAGTLGRAMAPALQALCHELVLSDLPAALAAAQAREPLLPGASVQPCDLADAPAVMALLQGVDAVVHFGGVSVEGPWPPILAANIEGLHHLYEAARRQGVKRIVFASSNHVTGCYRQDELITTEDAPRPDGNYGLSKLFGEGIASLYWQRHGIETVCLRIGSALPAPPDHRGLHTWLSLRDLDQLVARSLLAPDVGCLLVFGMSNNTRRFWNPQPGWQRIGYAPQDDSEVFADQVAHKRQPEGSAARLMQAGVFIDIGPFNLPGT
jgi:uronate dehydrogenase